MFIKSGTLKIKSAIPQKAAKILLWTLVVFLILRGIGSLLRTGEGDKAKAAIADFIASQEYKEKTQFEAAAFAEGFASEYLTYGGNTEDYTERLNKYVPSYLELGNGFSGSSKKAEALKAEALKVDWKSKNQFNIDVRVKMRYTVRTNTEGSIGIDNLSQGAKGTEKVVTNDVCLRIPVAAVGGRYVVEDYPAFVPLPDKANIKIKSLSGKEADTELQKKVTDVLASFFKTYYAGNPEEIAYYMLDSSKQVKGLEKRFEFDRIEPVSVYSLPDADGEYTALATLTVRDSINGQAIRQRFHISIVHKDGRYYIKDFNVRTGEINNQGG